MVITPVTILVFLVGLVAAIGILRGLVSCALRSAAVLAGLFVLIFIIKTVLAM